MGHKCIINCAITGAIHTPSMTPYLPITPEEIAEEAIGSANAGAATVHLHARDPETGRPDMNPELFKIFCSEVKAKSDVVICITTGGAPTMTPEERMVAVKALRPELASINMGSINFGLFPLTSRIKEYKYEWEKEYLESSKDLIFKNTFYDQERIFKIMEDCGTKPELECYDIGHLYNTAYWADKGVIKPPFWIQLILGIHGAIQPSVANLVFMKETADKLFGDDYVFSVIAAGKHEFTLGAVGVIMGGAVRVGLEDNLFVGKGELAKSNVDLVSKIRRIVEEFGIDIATPDDARKILGLKGKENTNF